jgi:hypothetical protein
MVIDEKTIMAKEISIPKICNNGMRASGNKKSLWHCQRL